MILKFEIENITDKEADDLADELLTYLNQQNWLVTEYWVENE